MNQSNATTSADASTQPSALTNTIRLLAQLAREKFFGKLTIELRDGQIYVIRREETIKP